MVTCIFFFFFFDFHLHAKSNVGDVFRVGDDSEMVAGPDFSETGILISCHHRAQCFVVLMAVHKRQLLTSQMRPDG